MRVFIIFAIVLLASCATKPPSPRAEPVAAEIPTKLEKHGDIRVDNYYWLNERENPKVIDYLNAENHFEDEAMKDTVGLQAKLFGEMKGRMKQDDTSAPEKEGSYGYYRRNGAGKEYPIYCRKGLVLGAREEVLVDVNALAIGHAFFNVTNVDVSPNGKCMTMPPFLYGTTEPVML